MEDEPVARLQKPLKQSTPAVNKPKKVKMRYTKGVSP
jgi:hypothetical protein